MEGLIPLLIRAIRKQSPHHGYRCLSGGSNRSYHLLIRADSFDGSSSSSHHRVSDSDYQPPPPTTTVDFPNEGSSVLSPFIAAGPTHTGPNAYQIWKESNANLPR